MKVKKNILEADGVFRTKLKNGATLLIKEDHATPVVSLNIWIEAGSIDEKPDERGMAHLIEHMIFKGTDKRGVGEISREVEAAGGYLNAFTSFEHTCFYVVLPSDQIQKALEIEFDAYFNSTFDGDELKKEKEVVFEEMRMRQDDPWSWSWELLFKILYQKNPYHWPVIGDLEILKKVPRETLLKYYKTHYVPSNTVISIVGDVSTNQVLHWVQKKFESSVKPSPPKRKFTFDKDSRGLRLKTEAGDVQQLYLSMGFPTVPIQHSDAASLEILEALLGDGAASRLNLAIREKSQSADEVGSDHFAGKYGGALVFQAFTDLRRVDKCLMEIMAEVKRIIREGVPEDELIKVKNKIKASKIFEKQNMDGQAKTIGFWELQGDYQLEEKFLARLDSVTFKEVQQVAEKYIQPPKASLLLYHPKSEKPNKNAGRWQALLQKGLDFTPPHAINLGSREQLQKLSLKNGSVLWVKERRGLPLVSLGAFVTGGFPLEKNLHGITALMTKCLLKGTEKKDHEEFSREVENLAAHLDPLMEKDYWGMTLDCLGSNFDKSFELMMECLFQPGFSPTEVGKEKKLQIAAIERLKDDPSEYALLQSDVLTFAQTPYAHMPMGTKESLAKITPKDLRKWHREHLGAKNMTWVAVGDFDANNLKKFLDSKLPLLPSSKPKSLIKVAARALKPVQFELKTDGRQANLVLGFRAPVFGSNEYFVFRVMNTLLNGMGGRLFVELREKRSLAYSVYAAHDAGVLAGAYQIYIGCAPSKVIEAKRELIELLSEFSKKKVSATELQRAKTYMIGLYRMGLQSNRSQVHSYARYEMSGLGASIVEKFPQLIQKVTAEDVQKAVKKYLQTNEKTWVLLTPKFNSKEK